MKTTVMTLALAGSLLFACSSSPPSGGGAGSDMTQPGVGGGGSGGSGGSGGGGGSAGSGGSGGASQDMTMMSSGGGDMAMVCGAPTDCPMATPVCCMRITLSGGTIPNCTTSSVKSDCETSAACPTMLNATCSGSQVVRPCKQNSDCTEGTYNACCQFMSNGAMTHFCANTTLASLGGGKCM